MVWHLGFFGLIFAPILRNDGVLTTFSNESLNKLLWNVIGGLVLTAYSFVTAAIHFWTLDRLGVLRVAVNAELEGLDVIKHNEPAYGYGTCIACRDIVGVFSDYYIYSGMINI